MGKRKRRADRSNTPPSDVLPPSSQMEGSLERRTSDQVGSSTMGSISSILETFHDPKKLPQVPHLSSHHHNYSRSILYKNPRYCSRKYYRRNILHNHGDASSSHAANDAHPVDRSMILKFSNKYSSHDSMLHTESFERAFIKPERIRSSSFGTDTVSGNVGKMVCGICERTLRKKLHSSGGIESSSDLSIVAVLVCGHVFHVECLEQKTCQTAQMDPPCPMCPRVTSTLVDASNRTEVTVD